MARFLRASAGSRRAENEKQTKGGAGAWDANEARHGTKRGEYGLIPAEP